MINYKKKCKRCSLSTSIPNIIINENGVCNVCIKKDEMNKKFCHDSLLNNMERLFENVKKSKKRGTYDVLVSFSGGKDSTYLLYLLKTKYNLNPLAFSVVHPFTTNSKLIFNTMEKVTKKLKVNLMKFYINDEDMFKKYIKYGMKVIYEKGLGPGVCCDLCNYFRSVSGYNMALKLKIPIYMNGNDIHQAPWPIFVNGDHKKKFLHNYFDWRMNIFKSVFKDKYIGSIYDLDIDKYNTNELPVIMFPLTFLPYTRDLGEKVLCNIGVAEDDVYRISHSCPAIAFFSYFTYKWYDSPMKIFSSASYARNACFRKSGRKLFPEKEYKKAILSAAKGGRYFQECLQNFKKVYSDNLNAAIKEKNISKSSVKRLRQRINSLCGMIKKIKYYAKYFNMKL